MGNNHGAVEWLKTVSLTPNAADVERIFEEFDSNHDGVLERDEFNSFIAAWCKYHKVKDVKAKQAEIWAKTDLNADGRVTKAEVMGLAAAANATTTATTGNVTSIQPVGESKVVEEAPVAPVGRPEIILPNGKVLYCHNFTIGPNHATVHATMLNETERNEVVYKRRSREDLGRVNFGTFHYYIALPGIADRHGLGVTFLLLGPVGPKLVNRAAAEKAFIGTPKLILPHGETLDCKYVSARTTNVYVTMWNQNDYNVVTMHKSTTSIIEPAVIISGTFYHRIDLPGKGDANGLGVTFQLVGSKVSATGISAAPPVTLGAPEVVLAGGEKVYGTEIKIAIETVLVTFANQNDVDKVTSKIPPNSPDGKINFGTFHHLIHVPGRPSNFGGFGVIFQIGDMVEKKTSAVEVKANKPVRAIGLENKLNEVVVGSDGFYHPSTEEQLIYLVQHANRSGVLLRVRGAAHSVSDAIYTDAAPDNHENDEDAPPGNNINVMLDNYRSFVIPPTKGSNIVEAQAGMNLGCDPSDPTKKSTDDNSFLSQIQNCGWTLSDLGGITHQTVSGFVSTGSSGGSLKHSIDRNLFAFRMIDGQGNIYTVSRTDENKDDFNAVALGLGLMGIISTITFECTPTFNIIGNEAITTYSDCQIDLFGNGIPGKKLSLEQFIQGTEYTRLNWWPQMNGERMIVWQANRQQPTPGFKPVPYTEFGPPDQVEATEAAISLFYTIIGNLDDLSVVPSKLRPTTEQLEASVAIWANAQGLGWFGPILAQFVRFLLSGLIEGAIGLLKCFQPELKSGLPAIFPTVLQVFMPLDGTKGAQTFQDYGWKGLPMDNQASDILVPVEFTEAWIPIGYTLKAMQLLREHFTGTPGHPLTPEQAMERTGKFAWELYGAGPSDHWMSPAYSDRKTDEWKDGVFRIDVFWFELNAGNPAAVFYPQFWQLLKDAQIPFRLHWAKFQPIIKAGDPDGWVTYFRAQYPRWDAFLAKRQQKDPNNIFLTDYWRSRLGLGGAARPKPITK